jgi:putative phosphoribosyl transferase
MFYDRIDAGTQLAARLQTYINEPGVVLAIPRGGVPVAYAAAKLLGFPVQIVLTKKIRHPSNREYAIGAANMTDYFVIPHQDVSDEYVEQEVERVRMRLGKMYTHFMIDESPGSIKGKTVIIIDDGIATGNTILGTIHLLLKSQPGKIIVAVPVASQSAVELLSKYADEVIALIVPHVFLGVGAYYRDFKQVSDETVKVYLDELRTVKRTG